MGDEARNVGLLKEAYKLWHDSKGGSVDHWMSMVGDDIRFGSIARGAAPLAFTQPISNKEALRGYFDGLLGDFAMIHYTIEDYVAEGDIVFVRCTTSWRSQEDRQVLRDAEGRLLALPRRQDRRVLRILRHRAGDGGGAVGRYIFTALICTTGCTSV